jgi:hypothetical protein
MHRYVKRLSDSAVLYDYDGSVGVCVNNTCDPSSYTPAEFSCDKGCADGACNLCASDAEEFMGHCWYLAHRDFKESCSALCQNKGLVYDEATRDIAGAPTAGSTANRDNCIALAALFKETRSLSTVTWGNGVGCTIHRDGPYLFSTPVTSASAIQDGHQRICACQEP